MDWCKSKFTFWLKTSDETSVPKPYSFWFHPHKSWTDILVSALVIAIMPLHELALGPPKEDGDVTTQGNQKIRNSLIENAPKSIKPAMTKWATTLGEDIVEVTLRIPRRKDILREWGFEYDQESLPAMPKGDILVTLRMPLSACSAADAALASQGTNEFGCRTLESIDLTQLDPKTPFCLAYHGGGLTVGSRHDDTCHNLAVATSLAAGKPIVLGSVEYTLAPTHVFPTAPAEALTVLSYLMEQLPKDVSFHVMGLSAGGNLATVSALELARKHPDRLSSLLALVPMVHPAADSVSMYMNSTSSYAPTAWLRWCWQCYLGLSPSNDKENILSLPTLGQRLVHGSNRSAWAASPWRQSSLARLADPTLDLPVSSVKNIPIAIQTNKGDPLYDDGISLFDALKSQGFTNLKHLDHHGSHWIGTMLDSKVYKEVTETWKEMMFGQS